MASAPTAPPPAAPEAPALSEGARLINVFIAPSKTFTDIRRNASWWVPWVIVSIMQVAFSFAFDSRVGWDTMMQQQIAKNPSAQARMEQLPADQREKILATQAKVAKYIGYCIPIFTLIGWVIAAAILMAIFNFGMGATIPFKRSMATFAYGGLPLLISGILSIATMYAVSPDSFNINNPLASNPAYAMDPANSRLLYWIASCLDAFGIWVIVVLGIGYSVASEKKVKTSTAIIVLAVLYILFKGWTAMRA